MTSSYFKGGGGKIGKYWWSILYSSEQVLFINMSRFVTSQKTWFSNIRVKVHIFWGGKKKSPPCIWLALHRTKVRWRFRKILWPSQNIWALAHYDLCSLEQSHALQQAVLLQNWSPQQENHKISKLIFWRGFLERLKGNIRFFRD